jgi:hypothetical protein
VDVLGSNKVNALTTVTPTKVCGFKLQGTVKGLYNGIAGAVRQLPGSATQNGWARSERPALKMLSSMIQGEERTVLCAVCGEMWSSR